MGVYTISRYIVYLENSFSKILLEHINLHLIKLYLALSYYRIKIV